MDFPVQKPSALIGNLLNPGHGTNEIELLYVLYMSLTAFLLILRELQYSAHSTGLRIVHTMRLPGGCTIPNQDGYDVNRQFYRLIASSGPELLGPVYCEFTLQTWIASLAKTQYTHDKSSDRCTHTLSRNAYSKPTLTYTPTLTNETTRQQIHTMYIVVSI